MAIILTFVLLFSIIITSFRTVIQSIDLILFRTMSVTFRTQNKVIYSMPHSVSAFSSKFCRKLLSNKPLANGTSWSGLKVFNWWRGSNSVVSSKWPFCIFCDIQIRIFIFKPQCHIRTPRKRNIIFSNTIEFALVNCHAFYYESNCINQELIKNLKR